MIKYAVYSRYIRSKTDKDLHFIGCRQLMQSYNVNPKECVCISDNKMNGFMKEFLDSLISLYPSCSGSGSGNYNLNK